MPNQKVFRGLCNLRLRKITTPINRLMGTPWDKQIKCKIVSARVNVTGVTISFDIKVELMLSIWKFWLPQTTGSTCRRREPD